VANYTLLATGTAANLAAAEDGDPTVASECLSLAGYDSYGAGASPGDHFQFADDGGDYRGTLTIKEGGTSGNRFVYEAYSGDTPVINGSDLIVTWSDEGSDIWSATVTTEPQQVWMDGTFGDRQEDLISCVNEYDWFWGSNVLYVFAASDPDTRYTTPGVEADQRQYCINTGTANYIDVDGLTITKCTQWGLYSQKSSNITIKNCIAEWGWLYGILQWQQTTDTTNVIIEDNTVRYCGQGGIGVSVIGTATLDGCIIRRNTVSENGRHQWHDPYWTANHTYTGAIKLYADHKTCSNIQVYENECHTNGPDGVTFTTSQRGSGIWIDEILGADGDPIIVKHNLCHGNYGSGIFLENTSWNDVFGNVIYDCALGSDESNPYASGGIKLMCRTGWDAKNNNIVNNTIYDCFIGIQAATYEEDGTQAYDDNTFKNNILAGCTYAIRTEDGAANDAWGSRNVYERNCCGTQSENFIIWDTTAYSTYDTWIAASSQTDNNIEADPIFTDAGGDDYTLAAGSPCIGAAEDLGAPYNAALLPASSWTAAVVTGSQDDY